MLKAVDERANDALACPKPNRQSDSIMATTSLLAGVAGEYFVAAELSRRGYIASITLRNTRGIDIVATNKDANRTVTIQCKTSRNDAKQWLLSDKSEDFHADTHFYVFVDLHGDLERPTYHIVPSLTVATTIKKSHSDWRKALGKGGRPHQDSSMRKFRDTGDDYLERWDLLGLG